MTFIAHYLLGAPSRHTGAFYVIIAIVGLVVVAAIVTGLIVIVLRNIRGQWPIR